MSKAPQKTHTRIDSLPAALILAAHRRYAHREATVKELCQWIGVSEPTLYRAFSLMGLPLRKVSGIGINSTKTQDVLRLLTEGEPISRITAETGVSRQYVSQVLQETGLPKPPRRPLYKPRPWLDEAICYYQSGLTAAEVARRLGVKPSEVYTALHKSGVEVRRGAEARKKRPPSEQTTAVLRRLSEGETPRQIAADLGIKTTKVHLIKYRSKVAQKESGRHQK